MCGAAVNGVDVDGDLGLLFLRDTLSLMEPRNDCRLPDMMEFCRMGERGERGSRRYKGECTAAIVQVMICFDGNLGKCNQQIASSFFVHLKSGFAKVVPRSTKLGI